MDYGIIIQATITGVLIALFGYFIDYCFWENSIFSRWLPFLAKMNIRLFKRRIYSMLNNSIDKDNSFIREAEMMFFYKILGGCIFCTNVWINIAYCFLVSVKNTITEFTVLLLIQIIVSHFILRKISND